MFPPLIRLAILICLVFVSDTAPAEDEIQFNRDVLPILSNHCFTCHGPDATTREGGLRLDQRDAALAAADSGNAAVVPGRASDSEMIRRVKSNDESERMPPAELGNRLTAEQISILEHWIERGAKYQRHWAFIAPRAADVPPVARSDWPQNQIDHFVLSKLERNGLRPAPVASRESLIRRVSFDLTGLPPTTDEIDRFLADRSPQAFERMVDRYLESPAYGEHMARQWLDLARYADSNGYQYDTERQQWVWRDWVIAAYNQNMPFDQFTIEQLAGDLLPGATPQQRLATGFNRNHAITIEGGIIDEEYRTEYVMDRLVTTGEVWLGLTIGCARCHDHKFDPISQKEFYQLADFFNHVPDRGMKGFSPQARILSPLASPEQQAFVNELNTELHQLRAKRDDGASLDRQFEQWTEEIAKTRPAEWEPLVPRSVTSSGGSTLTVLEDHSVLASGVNPAEDVYDFTFQLDNAESLAIRLEALTHESLPGNGPGRHRNSNFVLTEFEATAVSVEDPAKAQSIKFGNAVADYSQPGYEIGRAVDGVTRGNNGWAVDGPERKLPATAVFVAEQPFGFEAGTELRVRLCHRSEFGTHGMGRVRISVSKTNIDVLDAELTPASIVAIANTPKASRSADEADSLRSYFTAHFQPDQDWKERISEIEKQLAAILPPTMIMQDKEPRRATHVLNRGQYDQPTEQVSADVPAVFPQLPENAARNRLGLAKWMVDPSHPLTARVAVNRYWQRLFGTGLVKTSEDFGIQGERPSHPELLDWLAMEFIRSGWDVKHMQRLIIQSATYQQSSHVGGEAYGRDPENRLLGRGPRMRLSAEAIRDAALAASGLLVQQVGGPSVYPYQPPGLWLELNNRPGFSKEYPQGDGSDLYRRSLYTFWKRTVPSPMLKTLDAPEREFCTVRRSRTNTPLQALLLLNGPQFVEAARKLGQRMLIDGGDTIDERIEYGFRLVTSRRPNSSELSVLRDTYQSELSRFSSDEAATKKLLQVGRSVGKDTLNPVELAAFTSVARLILNLDEAITKG